MFRQYSNVPSAQDSKTYSAVVEPDYFQFYARRSGAAWASDMVTEEGYAAHLWTDGQFIYVGTRRKFGPTPIEVTVSRTRPEAPDDSWQHVVEVSLTPGGPLEVFSWGDDRPLLTTPLPSGDVRMRVSWKGLVAGRFEGLDENGESEERLALGLWAGPIEAPKIVREWRGWPQ